MSTVQHPPVALIVDDEEELCLLLGSYLRKQQTKSIYAFNLSTAFEKAILLRPDLVFLDHNLPDGTGLEALPKLMKLLPNAKFIMISAMENIKSEAMLKGAYDFIEKPLSFGALDKVLATIHN
jgi:DNA-binding NtrC family response regulator